MSVPTKNTHRLALAVSALMLAFGASVASASGSMTPGGGQGGDPYNVGKAVFFKEVVCATCPYAARAKNAADAKAVLMALKSAESKVKLDSDDLDAVTIYLSKRFSLTTMAGK